MAIDESNNITIEIGKKIFELNLLLSILESAFTYVLPYSYLTYSAIVNRITVGSVAALYSTIQMLSYAISDLVGNFLQIANNSLYVDNLLTVLNFKNLIENETDSKKIKCQSINKIEFKNISFSYDDDNYVLNDFSLLIENGEKVAIVGHNGAGKSTLIKLLLRLYDVQRRDSHQ